MIWEILISKAENGFILNYTEEHEDGSTQVHEVIEDNDNEKEAMEKLLYRLADYFGMHNDRYAKDNLNITWDKKGDKAE